MTVEPVAPPTFYDLPDTRSPLKASILNPAFQSGYTNAQAAYAAAALAQEAAAAAAAPTDEMVAALVGVPSATTDALIAAYTRIGVVVDARLYGAIGDQATTDDTAACQAALTAGGGLIGSRRVVVFPAGTFNVDPLYLPDKFTMVGSGPATLFKRRPATVTNTDSIGVLNAHGESGTHFTDVTIRDLQVDANKANITVGGGGDPYDVEGISFKYVDRARVEGVVVRNATAEGFDWDDCDDGLLLNSYAYDCGGAGCHFSNGCVRMRAVGCYASGCGATLSRGGFDAYSGSQDCAIVACVTVSCYRGVTLGGPGSLAVGCQDYTPTDTGLLATGAGSVFSSCRTTGNISHTGTSGSLVGCVAGGTLAATNAAVHVSGCTPDTPPEATLTYATNWGAASGQPNRVVRRGQWVTATFRFDKSSGTATEQETMATLPAGFLPAEAQYVGGMVFNGSSAYVAGGIQIQASGQIQARISGATGVTRVVGQATWRVA